MSENSIPLKQCLSKELCIHPDQINNGYLPETRDFFYYAHEAPNRRCKECFKKWSSDYYNSHKKECSERKKVYYQHNSELIKQKNNQYRKGHPEESASRNKRYRQQHPEETRANKKRYNERYPEKLKKTYQVHNQRRRARKNGLPNTLSASDWRFALDYFHHCCAVCGVYLDTPFFEIQTHADHWVPLSAGGGTTADNIVPLCGGAGCCNQLKSDRNAHDWLLERFGEKQAKKIEKRISAYFRAVKNR